MDEGGCRRPGGGLLPYSDVLNFHYHFKALPWRGKVNLHLTEILSEIFRKGENMNYITATYWQRGDNTSALLLQQCQVGGMPVLFVCLCAGNRDHAGGRRVGVACGYLSEQLLQWFRTGQLVRAVRNPESFLVRQQEKLESLIRQTDRELAEAGLISFSEKTALAGAFCIGRDCLFFGRGEAKIYLLNRSMGSTCACPAVQWGKTLYIRQAVLEPDIGLWLTTASFEERVSGQALQSCLSVEEVKTERQAERHLQELGQLAEASGGGNMAAALCLVREDLEREEGNTKKHLRKRERMWQDRG